MTISVNDLAGRDYYEVWKRLVTKQNSDRTEMEGHTKLRTNRWEKTQAAQGISKSSIVTDAKRIKKETGDKENPYSAQAVPRWDTGLCDKIMKSLGMYPEPPLRRIQNNLPVA